MKKRFLAVILAALMVLPMFTVSAETDENYATRGEVADMLLNACDDYTPDTVRSDIIKGYEDGELHEERHVTRAEALVMLFRAFGGFPELKGYYSYLAVPKEDFNDIPVWANEELNAVFDAGLAAGKSDGVFAPDDYVTKDEMKLFIERAFALKGTNIKDNFFTGINHEILENLSLGDGKYTAGPLYDIQDKVDKEILDLITEAAESDAASDTPEGKVKILYNNIMDKESQNKESISPLIPYLEEIDKADSIDELVEFEKKIYSDLADYQMFQFSVTIDADDSDSYIVDFSTIAASQAKEVYTGEADYIKNAYLTYLTDLGKLIGDDEETAVNNAQKYFEFEAQLSDASLNPEDYYDISKTNNIYTLDEIDKLFTSVDMKAFFDITGLEGKDRICVADVGCTEKFAELLTNDNIDIIKNHVRLGLVMDFASCFGDEFVEAGDKYYESVTGTSGKESDDILAAAKVGELLSVYVDKMYRDAHYSQETIDNVTGIIDEVIAVYKERIGKLDWMSDSTKERAILKLDKLTYKIGAEENFKDYLASADLKAYANGGGYFQNVAEIYKAIQSYYVSLENTKVDKEEWLCPSYTVNAFYNLSGNDVTIPFAFLCEPFYSDSYSYEQNLGGIGFVIGHELTHAFDNGGSQYDENGNAVNWWTEQDAEAFENLCQKVIDYYDGREAAPGIAESGKLTLSENIADLGSISCITEVASKHDGFDYKAMYEQLAKSWVSVITREMLKQYAMTDVHSLLQLRVNPVLQSVDKFYEVYDITESDGMWIAPENRVRIW